MIRKAAQFLYWSAHHFGINKTWINHLIKKPDVKLILNYHHILSYEQFDPGLKNGFSHYDASFDSQMGYLRENFRINTDLDDYSSVTLTFDDGAKNNFVNAIPILEKYDIKAWFFLNDRHQINSPQRVLWVDELYHWLDNAPSGHYDLGSLSETMNRSTITQFEDKLFTHLASNYHEKKSILEAMAAAGVAPLDSEAMRHAVMSIDDLELVKRNGHELGFHTNNHEILSGLTSDELAQELTPPEYLQSLITNHDVLSIPFGFPNTVSDCVFKSIFDKGYKTILLNEVHSKGASIKGRINMVNSDRRPKISSYLARWPLFIYEG